jgi:hypothetical protein
MRYRPRAVIVYVYVYGASGPQRADARREA